MVKIFFRITLGHKQDADEKEIRAKVSFSKKSSSKKKWTKLASTVATEDVEDDEELLIDDGVTFKKRNCCSKGGPSLVLALFMTFKGQLLAAGFFKFCQDTLGFASPLLLRYCLVSSILSVICLSISVSACLGLCVCVRACVCSSLSVGSKSSNLISTAIRWSGTTVHM